MNLYEAQKLFWTELKEVIESNNMDSIYVNAYIGTAIQDYFNFVFIAITKTSPTTEPYLVGTFGEAEVYVDPMKKYSDHNLYDKNGKIIHDFKVNFGNVSLV
jgi:hypothetical protein